MVAVGVVGFPGVVVGGEADHGVGEFGFACEACFGHGGHADEVAAPGAVHGGLGAGGEGGAFHTYIGAFGVGLDVGESGGGVEEPASGDGAEGFGEFDVYGGVFEEGVGAAMGFIDDLVGDEQVAGVDVFAE